MKRIVFCLVVIIGFSYTGYAQLDKANKEMIERAIKDIEKNMDKIRDNDARNEAAAKKAEENAKRLKELEANRLKELEKLKGLPAKNPARYNDAYEEYIAEEKERKEVIARENARRELERIEAEKRAAEEERRKAKEKKIEGKANDGKAKD